MAERNCIFVATLLVVCSFAVPQCFGQYDSEPNQTFDTASNLPLNTASSGSVNGDSDSMDWYKIEIPEDGELTITITHDPSDFQFLFYGTTEQDLIAGTETNAPSGRQMFITVQKGTYRLQVNSRNNPTPVPYTVTAAFVQVAAATEDSEPNDTYETASALTLNATQTGHIDFMGTGAVIDGVDYYAVNVPEDATVTITTTYDPESFDFQFILYASDGSTAITGTQTNLPSGGSRTAYLAAGTYYLLINGRSFYATVDHGRVYSVLVATDAAPVATGDVEPNGTAGTASDLDAGTGATGHITFIDDEGNLDNYDYWNLNIPGTETVGVWVTMEHDPVAGDFQFYVLDSAEQWVSGTGTSAPSPFTIDFQTEPGQYYLVINGRRTYVGRTYNASVIFYDPEVGTPTPTPTVTPTRTPVPVQTPNSVHSDVNNDGFIDETDMLILQSDWHKFVEPRQE